MTSFRWLAFKLHVGLLPRRALCFVTTLNRHRYGSPEPVMIDGPIDLPPRERDWAVIAFHRQCDRCYKVKDTGYSFVDAVTAVREAIEEDEDEDTHPV